MTDKTNVDRQSEPGSASVQKNISPVKPLEYDNRNISVTRGQMRFFLLLLAVNTFLFAAFICLPSASPFLKQWWSDYQAKREADREAAKRVALMEACMNFDDSPDTLVYSEPTPDAAKLLSQAGRSLTIDQAQFGARNNGANGLFGGQSGFGVDMKKDLLANGWSLPAVRARVQPLVDLNDYTRPGGAENAMSDLDDDSVVFLHSMKTPSGSRRLVWIALRMVVDPILLDNQETKERKYEITIHRMLSALVFDPEFERLKRVETSAVLTSSTAKPTTIVLNPKGANTVRWNDQWRIFAGQIDPANPSHVTIAYDIDGKGGVIDGWLKDGDRLMLEPRVGQLTHWNSGLEYEWDLGAAPVSKPTGVRK